MPSTYTNRIRAEKPATGEQSGVWGSTANQAVFDLFDEAIYSIGNIAMTDADMTLTVPNGTTSANRAFVLTFTGSLTANRTITLPAIDRRFEVENKTTGGFSLLVKTPTSATVTVGPGASSVLYAVGATLLAPKVSFPAGTAALPGIAFTGDTDTGMWNPSSNVIGFSVNGLQYAAIQANLVSVFGEIQIPTTQSTVGLRQFSYPLRFATAGYGVSYIQGYHEPSVLAGIILNTSATNRWDFNSQGLLTCPGNILTSGFLYGGFGNGGTLRTSNTNNRITFLWDGQSVSWNIDGSVQQKVCTQTNTQNLNYAAGGGGPTGIALNGQDLAGVVFGIFVDVVSDERIKTNITDTKVDALSVINSIPIREFDILADIAAKLKAVGSNASDAAVQSEPEHVPIGLVAQELMRFIPEAVSIKTQQPGSFLPEDMHTVVQQMIVPYLMRSIQQLTARVAELEARK